MTQDAKTHDAVPVAKPKLTMAQALLKGAGGALDMLHERLDAWENAATGFGTTRDKTTYGAYEPFVRISDLELSSMYHGEDMAARVVNVVPDEMFREGFKIDVGDVGLNTELAEMVKRLNVQEKFADGFRWGGLYGGAAVLIGCDDGQTPDKELKPERAKDIGYLYVIERRVLWPVTYYTAPNHPKLGEPETYVITPTLGGGTGGATTVVHESRLILFRGAKTGAFEKLAMAGWDISVLQRPYEILRQFNTGWKAVETLLTDGNQAVFRMTGLADMIGANQQNQLRRRLTVMELYRSVMRALVIDADSDESYERTSVSFEGIHQVLDKLCIRLAAAAEMPVTILMGQSPAGMNATGDADFRWFFNRIRAKQTTEAAPRIRRLVEIWLQTKASPVGGRTVEAASITIDFEPLWTETPSEEATRRMNNSTADLNYFNMGALTPEEIALSRFTPEGYGDEIKLEDASREAREKMLAMDLKDLSEGNKPGALPPAAPGAPPTAAGKAPPGSKPLAKAKPPKPPPPPAK